MLMDATKLQEGLNLPKRQELDRISFPHNPARSAQIGYEVGWYDDNGMFEYGTVKRIYRASEDKVMVVIIPARGSSFADQITMPVDMLTDGTI